MATGLQFKENLTIISGGYRGEGVGSNGVTQNWTETQGDSGNSTVTYWYHDSAQMNDRNSTLVEVSVTDSWTAVREADNTYKVTIHSVMNFIRRTKVGSPSALSASIFVRRERGGPNIWTSGGCVNAATSATHATNVDLGTYTITLPPGQSAATHGAIYYRSNICGYDSTNPPSAYVDEYWLGINFRNTLPPDYRPGQTWSNTGSSVQTVTGTSINVSNTLQSPFEDLKVGGDTQQTTYSGKNLLNVASSYNVPSGVRYYEVAVNLQANKTYTIQFDDVTTDGSGWFLFYFNYNMTGASSQIIKLPNKSVTFTASTDISKVFIYSDSGYSTSLDTNTTYTNLMISESSSPTSYEPYVGGTASPNPDYPQTVQTVTGEQTITISDGNGQSQSYSVNLGDIELCKIGTYQDYIYKSGEDWYIHKETIRLDVPADDSSEISWDANKTRLAWNVISYGLSLPASGAIATTSKSNKFTAGSFDYVYIERNNGFALSNSGYLSFIDLNWADEASARVSLAGTVVYAPLATPTDRQVLEPALIAQLNAIENGGSYTGTTTINVTGDLASPLTVGVRVATGSGTWQSHNRNDGWAGVYNGSTFKEMRTVNGPDGTGDPPTIKHPSGWKNQRKIGLNS